MDYYRVISIFVLVITILSTFSCVFAVGSDDQPLNMAGEHTIYVSHFTTASKIAFTSYWSFKQSINMFTGTCNLPNFNHLMNFFNGIDRYHQNHSSPIKNGKETLFGVYLVNFTNCKSAFLIYGGRNSRGNNILEDLKKAYKSDNETLDQLFKSNVIFFSTTEPEFTIIKDKNAVLIPVKNSENIQIVPYNNSSTKAGWDDAHNHPRIITIASTIIGNTGNSDEAKIRGIWNWMHGSDRHMIYHAHEGTKDSLDQGLDSGKGNCCEQARILVGLARAAGMKAEFVKVPGHVFSRIFVNGAWIAVDTCYEWGYNRKIPYGATLCDVLNW